MTTVFNQNRVASVVRIATVVFLVLFIILHTLTSEQVSHTVRLLPDTHQHELESQGSEREDNQVVFESVRNFI